ncbi:MAG: (2Fe-2S) ferredoxin domain-containing protein [Synergistetes bacterium]|nr:(2Fe-2S) ferredoxin domain-containing protein [Synergistota bacterium]MCX8128160.1 (2Fe-2S) ferredoxin domain-containing protein [Synergistota bacterium]MDW8192536.1 (2Fe-2S) ferredoxin domain-containing protein [Synergistota bacterium]
MKIEELRKLREKVQEELKLRESIEPKVKIIVSMGTSGIAAGAREVLKAFLDEISKRGLKDVIVLQTGEKGLASAEPLVEVITPEASITYGRVTPEVARRIVVEHVINGRIVSEYVV